MAKHNQKKIRAEFRKGHEKTSRQSDLTGEFRRHGFEQEETVTSQRVSGKGEVTRKRTIIAAEHEAGADGSLVQLAVTEQCRPGRVLSVHGLNSVVLGEDGLTYRCVTRGLLKSLITDQRQAVAVGDRVQFRPEGPQEGFIERVESRHAVLSRTSKGRQHVLVANVDQLLIVASVAEPELKPHLIDRFLVAAEKHRIKPIICLNKLDLIHRADVQPLVGVYGQMGYEVILLSAATGFNTELLRRKVRGQASVVAGQSGVGKSSLLNALDPGLALPVGAVSRDNQKGRHTTTTARLLPNRFGGWFVDTPGVRQFQPWEIVPAQVPAAFRDLRPLANLCRYPDCSHDHEDACAVKDAVADGLLDTRRWESCLQMAAGDDRSPEDSA